MNPYSETMMRTWYAYRALAGMDENCADYIAFAEAHPQAMQAAPISAAPQAPQTMQGESELQHAIVKGLRERASALTEQLIAGKAPLDIVQSDIIPALDIVGIGFENKTVYLPQLLMSAEAASAAFEVIKAHMPAGKGADRYPIVLATVKGDIHDIGKNIVKLLLENYGFAVTDLGRDVPPERIVEAAIRLHAPLVGLSALMTTTVPAMEDTIKALRESAPWVRVVVGGAVLTQEYADAIGADCYAKDAMETVRYAEELEKQQNVGR
jgi:5-methyltetrahydrofolate--homocysteine methyltransferase